VIDRGALTWRGYALYLGARTAPLLCVVPDGDYPNMWRVKHPDGRLSDMANLSRAKDAGMALAQGELNQKTGPREPRRASPMRFSFEVA
jgi:hypothetical protein